jgi:hypothetical protein
MQKTTKKGMEIRKVGKAIAERNRMQTVKTGWRKME